MKFRDKIIALLLCCGGIVFFILSLIPATDSSEPRNSDYYYQTEDQLDTSSYSFKIPNEPPEDVPSLTDVGDSTKRVMALYLMPAAACGNCLNEVDEYVGLLNDTTSNLELDQVIWFHGETEQYARQFALVADFELPKLYSVTSFLPPRLTSFHNETVDGQLIVIDKTAEQVMFRVQLPKGAMTPVEDKENILNELASILDSRAS